MTILVYPNIMDYETGDMLVPCSLHAQLDSICELVDKLRHERTNDLDDLKDFEAKVNEKIVYEIEKNEEERLGNFREMEEDYKKQLTDLKFEYENFITIVFENHRKDEQKWMSQFDQLNSKLESSQKNGHEDAEIVQQNVKLSEDLNKANVKIDQLLLQVKELQSDKKSLEKEAARHSEDLAKAKAEHRREESKLREKVNEIKNLKSELKEKDLELKAQLEKCSELESKLVDLESTVTDVTAPNQALHEKSVQTETHFESIVRNRNLSESEVSVVDENSSHTDLLEKYVLLKIELRKMKRDLERKSSLVNLYRDENVISKASIQTLEEKLLEAAGKVSSFPVLDSEDITNNIKSEVTFCFYLNQ